MGAKYGILFIASFGVFIYDFLLLLSVGVVANGIIRGEDSFIDKIV